MMAEIYGKVDRLVRRQGRLDAHRRPVQGHARRQRHRRRRPAADLRRARSTAKTQGRRRRRGRVLRRRRLQPGHDVRALQPGDDLEPARRSSSSENNGYAEATSSTWSVATDDIADRAGGFGMPGVIVDGYDFFAVYEAAGEAVARARAGGGPTLHRGQAHPLLRPLRGRRSSSTGADEVAQRPREPRLPQALPRRASPRRACSPTAQLDAIDAEVGAAHRPSRRGRQGRAEAGRGRPAHRRLRLVLRSARMARSITYREAINEALRQEMERDPRVIVMGEDIAGGAGLAGRGGRLGRRRSASPRACYARVRPDRVLDTPISESAFIGAAVGAARDRPAPGRRADVRRLHGRLLRPDLQPGRQVPLHVRRQGRDAGGHPHDVRRRLPRGRAAQPVRCYPIFTHIPGLKVVVAVERLRRQGPADPGDPRRRPGHLLRAQDALRRGGRGAGREPTRSRSARPTSCARATTSPSSRSGAWCSIAQRGRRRAGVERGSQCEVVDPRTTSPLDTETILETVEKTGRWSWSTRPTRAARWRPTSPPSSRRTRSGRCRRRSSW